MNTQKLLTDKYMTMYIYLIIQSRLSKTKEPTKEIYSICKFHTDFLKTIKLSLDTPYSKKILLSNPTKGVHIAIFNKI